MKREGIQGSLNEIFDGKMKKFGSLQSFRDLCFYVMHILAVHFTSAFTYMLPIEETSISLPICRFFNLHWSWKSSVHQFSAATTSRLKRIQLKITDAVN